MTADFNWFNRTFRIMVNGEKYGVCTFGIDSHNEFKFIMYKLRNKESCCLLSLLMKFWWVKSNWQNFKNKLTHIMLRSMCLKSYNAQICRYFHFWNKADLPSEGYQHLNMTIQEEISIRNQYVYMNLNFLKTVLLDTDAYRI